MNFSQAFSYPFQDPDWLKKLLIPALISLIPIVGWIFLLGWGLDITRRVIQRNPNVLPDVDFGRQIVDGLKGFVIGLVYGIPAMIFSIPQGILSTIMANNGDSNSASLLMIVSICCGGLSFLYSLFLAIVLPAAYARFIANENLGAAFNFGEVIGLVRKNVGAYLMVLVGTLLSSIIASLGVILCFIGVFLTLTYAMAINGHLYGQAYNEANRESGFARVY